MPEVLCEAVCVSDWIFKCAQAHEVDHLEGGIFVSRGCSHCCLLCLPMKQRAETTTLSHCVRVSVRVCMCWPNKIYMKQRRPMGESQLRY